MPHKRRKLLPKPQSLSTEEIPNQQKWVCTKPLMSKKKKKIKNSEIQKWRKIIPFPAQSKQRDNILKLWIQDTKQLLLLHFYLLHFPGEGWWWGEAKEKRPVLELNWHQECLRYPPHVTVGVGKPRSDMLWSRYPKYGPSYWRPAAQPAVPIGSLFQVETLRAHPD